MFPDQTQTSRSTDASVIAQLLTNADHSLANAEKRMEATKKTIELYCQTKNSHDRISTKTGEIVHAMLDPAYQVAKVLEFLGSVGGPLSPCATAGSALATLVTFEKKRRHHDVRVLTLHMELTQALYTLCKLPSACKDETALTLSLNALISDVCKTMEDFGAFCDTFYASGTIKRYIQTTINEEIISRYREKFLDHKHSILELISHQTLILSVSHNVETTKLKDAVARIEKGIQPLCDYFMQVTISKEQRAKEFIESHGGEETLKKDESVLVQFAQHMDLPLTTRDRNLVQEPKEQYTKRTQDTFMLKYEFALERRIVESRDTILNELKSGAHEYIVDPMMRAVWKDTARNETTIKRRRFIDAFKNHLKTASKAYSLSSPDAWTKTIISRVHYHAAICDAIDDDVSGYISVEELNQFMSMKPPNWSVPQWIAYWAYGWDEDNIKYGREIIRIIEYLTIRQNCKHTNSEGVVLYLQATSERLLKFVGNPAHLNQLEPEAAAKMEHLCREWQIETKSKIWQRLKRANFRVDFASIEALSGSERLEVNIMPLLNVVLHHHMLILLGNDVINEADLLTMVESVTAILDALHARVDELAIIWRRQRVNVDTQFEYYANGLLNNYYKEHKLVMKSHKYDETHDYEFDLDYMRENTHDNKSFRID